MGGAGEWEAPGAQREENQKFPVSSTDDSQLHSEATDRPFQEVPSFSSILEAAKPGMVKVCVAFYH